MEEHEDRVKENGRIISAPAEDFSILGFAKDAAELKEKLKQGKVYRLYDRFFKFLFGKLEHKHLFLSFVNSIIFPDGENTFADLKFVEREYVPPSYIADQKECRLDIVGKLACGRLINIELQVKSERDYIKRSVYYFTMLHAGQLTTGNDYGAIRDTISIHILGFNLFDDKYHAAGFRNSFSLRNDETSEKLCDDLSLIYLEMPKYIKLRKERTEPMNGLERWMCYFTGLEDDKMYDQMLEDPVIKEALSLEKLFIGDWQERMAYFLTFKAVTDAANREMSIRRDAIEEGREEGMAKGMEQGMEQGREKERAVTVRRMLSRGMSVAQIADIFEISDEQVCQLSEDRAG